MQKSAKKAVQFLMGASLLGLSVAFMATPASALHSWGGYHWARTENPFTLLLGDNVGSLWDSSLNQASTDWSTPVNPLTPDVLDTPVVAGKVSDLRKCNPTSGRVEVCSYKYGYRGWLGLAQIWLTGNHITKGIVKLNDSYYSLSTYNNPEWRRLVMCQEVGHAFGLDHQDENQTNANLGTCMDYTNNPSGPPSNEHPNAHDYDWLANPIYAHNDGFTTVGTTAAASAAARADDWGRAIRFTKNGKGRIFVKDIGPNQQMVTFVTWVSE